MIVSFLGCWAVTLCLGGTGPVSVSRYDSGDIPKWLIYRGLGNVGTNSTQIVIYVFARVMLALAKLSVEPNMHPLSHMVTPGARAQITNNAWPVFASLTWAFVMYIFRWYPETLISSLRSSMYYMYVVIYPFLYIYNLHGANHDTAMRTRTTGTHSGTS